MCQVYGAPQFECAAVDCVETFDKDLQQCVSIFELESCCSVGNVCGECIRDRIQGQVKLVRGQK